MDVLAIPLPDPPPTQEGPQLDTIQGRVAWLGMLGLAIRVAEVDTCCTELAEWSVVIIHAW